MLHELGPASDPAHFTISDDEAWLAMNGTDVKSPTPSGCDPLTATVEGRAPEIAWMGTRYQRRLQERAAGIQLIAMTGYGQDMDRRRSRNAGFVYHLVKPFDLEQLAEILERVSG